LKKRASSILLAMRDPLAMERSVKVEAATGMATMFMMIKEMTALGSPRASASSIDAP
jgi:hypothetical protein